VEVGSPAAEPSTTMTAPGPTLFRSVDIASLGAALTQRLRDAGIEVGMSATGRFADALAQSTDRSMTTLYWMARITLVHDHRDLVTFDAVFAAVFDGNGLPRREPRPQPRGSAVVATGTVRRHSAEIDGLAAVRGRLTTTTTASVVEADETDEEPAEPSSIPLLVPSELAHLADRPFETLEPDELHRIGEWLQRELASVDRRRSRRTMSSSTSGTVDMRRTLARARATGGEVAVLRRWRPRRRRRDLVMVADVSASMEAFTRGYLHLMHGLVAHGDAEVFTFATELRRVTVALREGDPQRVNDALGHEVADRFGGTRIASSITALSHSPVWSNTVRGAVVIIASDGCDTDEADALGAAMARLARMAHRVIWLNPRAADDRYEPLAAAMAAALPHIDHFSSGHTLTSLTGALREDPARRK
jgi:uncharacterized protein with von Willebrand factor type A (vWA) domain